VIRRTKAAGLVGRYGAACVAMALAAMISLSAQAGQGGARDVVERLHATLLDVMQRAETLGYRGRAEVLAPVLEASYDLPLMARVTVGRHWRKLDDEQRRRLVAAFSRLTVATYALRFDGYSGQRFEVTSQSPAGEAEVVVRSRILSGDGDPVALAYLVRRDGERWRIVDVYLKDKYSELARRRAEFSGIIRRQGFDALIAAIDDKVRKMEGP